jgi:hypothetical protein
MLGHRTLVLYKITSDGHVYFTVTSTTCDGLPTFTSDKRNAAYH